MLVPERARPETIIVLSAVISDLLSNKNPWLFTSFISHYLGVFLYCRLPRPDPEDTTDAGAKLHLAVDAGTDEVAAHVLTDSDAADAPQLPDLLRRIESRLTSIITDGAYEGEPVYRAAAACQHDLRELRSRARARRACRAHIGPSGMTRKAFRVPGEVTLMPLPPYSPELNPIERLCVSEVCPTACSTATTPSWTRAAHLETSSHNNTCAPSATSLKPKSHSQSSAVSRDLCALDRNSSSWWIHQRKRESYGSAVQSMQTLQKQTAVMPTSKRAGRLAGFQQRGRRHGALLRQGPYLRVRQEFPVPCRHRDDHAYR